MELKANGSWLLQTPDEPAANLSALILERENLTPPVPVEDFISTMAKIEECFWPYECDAVVVGLLDSDRKTVFIRSGLHRLCDDQIA